jgi:glucokinase
VNSPAGVQTGLVIGIDVGGTKIAGSLMDAGGRTLASARVGTPSQQGASAIIDAIVGLADALTEPAAAPVDACGIGSAGTFDEAGTVVHATEHLRGWQGTKVAETVQARLGMPVTAINDVHAAALGELWQGSSARHSRMFFAALGTGISGALVTDGKVVRGESGYAGSIGHVPAELRVGRRCSCGALDHVEAYASGPGIERSYAESSGVPLQLEAIAARAHDGESRARDVISRAAEIFGHALAMAITLTDPGRVVLGGGVLGIGADFVDAVRASALESLRPPLADTQITATRLGNTAATTGAALLARRMANGGHLADWLA